MRISEIMENNLITKNKAQIFWDLIQLINKKTRFLYQIVKIFHSIANLPDKFKLLEFIELLPFKPFVPLPMPLLLNADDSFLMDSEYFRKC